jgi:hypothetical protein
MLFALYLRHAFWPAALGPSYSVRVIWPAGITLSNFWLPLAAGAVVIVALGLWPVGAARPPLDWSYS